MQDLKLEAPLLIGFGVFFFLSQGGLLALGGLGLLVLGLVFMAKEWSEKS